MFIFAPDISSAESALEFLIARCQETKQGGTVALQSSHVARARGFIVGGARWEIECVGEVRLIHDHENGRTFDADIGRDVFDPGFVRDPHATAGVWFSEERNLVVVDRGDWFPESAREGLDSDPRGPMSIARARGEESIWDCLNGRCIPVN